MPGLVRPRPLGQGPERARHPADRRRALRQPGAGRWQARGVDVVRRRPRPGRRRAPAGHERGAARAPRDRRGHHRAGRARGRCPVSETTCPSWCTRKGDHWRHETVRRCDDYTEVTLSQAYGDPAQIILSAWDRAAHKAPTLWLALEAAGDLAPLMRVLGHEDIAGAVT